MVAPRTPRTPAPRANTPKSAKSVLKKKTPRNSATPVSEAKQKALADAELARERELVSDRLKSSWELIFQKYGQNFDDIADEIDPVTGEIVVDNGHLRGMQDESELVSDDEVFRWGDFLNPDRPPKSKSKKRKRDDNEEDVCAACEDSESGTCGRCESKGTKALPFGSLINGSVPADASSSDGVPSSPEDPQAPLLTQLPSDDFLLAQLGSYGPAVLKAMRSFREPKDIPSNAKSSSPSMPPLDSRSKSTKSSTSKGQTAEVAKYGSKESMPSTPEPSRKKRKTMTIVIPDSEMDELCSPDSPSISSLYRKLASPIAAKSTPTKSIGKGKGKESRLSISIVAGDDSEDELQSHAAPTPVSAAGTPIPTSSRRQHIPFTPKRFSIPTPTFKPIPRSVPPVTLNPWSKSHNDPFFSPLWDDEHPDGTPFNFPIRTPTALIPQTPLFAESPIVKALKHEVHTTPAKRQRKDAGTPSRANPLIPQTKQKDGPRTPGWTTTPGRRGSALLDFFMEELDNQKVEPKKEEAKKSSPVTAELPAKDRESTEKTTSDKVDGKTDSPAAETGQASSSKPVGVGAGSSVRSIGPAAEAREAKHSDLAQKPVDRDGSEPNEKPESMEGPSPETPVPTTKEPAQRSFQKPSPPVVEAPAESTLPLAEDSDVEMISAKKVKRPCGTKGYMCRRFCFKCISAMDLSV
ncbi:hypothetical protein FN846DRAFT_950785 [Sphaerosporella brunnea]|uniref:Uncharacterized protein n=1 Tax=Sphaerosporella brunnea TaxID=1250544 RepID=A0A5J5EVJ4_9PEZI|nr:hypothetical protein FN846DRAFT_950785 [Sphaerosporella brunnea]